jgi:hypothetical protein
MKRALRKEELFNFIYQNEDFSDPLRLKLASTSFNSHLEKLKHEGVIYEANDTLYGSHSKGSGA